MFKTARRGIGIAGRGEGALEGALIGVHGPKKARSVPGGQAGGRRRFIVIF